MPIDHDIPIPDNYGDRGLGPKFRKEVDAMQPGDSIEFPNMTVAMLAYQRIRDGGGVSARRRVMDADGKPTGSVRVWRIRGHKVFKKKPRKASPAAVTAPLSPETMALQAELAGIQHNLDTTPAPDVTDPNFIKAGQELMVARKWLVSRKLEIEQILNKTNALIQ